MQNFIVALLIVFIGVFILLNVQMIVLTTKTNHLKDTIEVQEQQIKEIKEVINSF